MILAVVWATSVVAVAVAAYYAGKGVGARDEARWWLKKQLMESER